jgi:hypothetical protein
MIVWFRRRHEDADARVPDAIREANGDCPSCGHPLSRHEAFKGDVVCSQQVDDGDDWTVDCWLCELTAGELAVLLAKEDDQ